MGSSTRPWLARLEGEYARLEFALVPGVIHGDASIGNVLPDWEGRPVVIDLDDFAVGCREWDLVQTAMYFDSFGWHTRKEHADLVRVYGFDIMQWLGYPVMRTVRELVMTTWVVQKADDSDRMAAGASKRIAALRSGASRRDWKTLLTVRQELLMMQNPGDTDPGGRPTSSWAEFLKTRKGGLVSLSMMWVASITITLIGVSQVATHTNMSRAKGALGAGIFSILVSAGLTLRHWRQRRSG